MHAHANTYMATGNYRWLGKGTIQNIHLLRAVVSNVNYLTHVVPNQKKKVLKNMTTLFSIMKANVE